MADSVRPDGQYISLMWSINEIIHIWTAVVDESQEWSSQLIFQFKQLERRSLKNQGFYGIRTRDLDTGAMLYQLSYEATRWEWGQFIEFISSVRSDMMWSIYEIIDFISGHSRPQRPRSFWSAPRIAILDVDQKERGLWGREWSLDAMDAM